MFHAKEYPDDLVKSSPPRWELLKLFKETLGPKIKRLPPNKNFTRRNFVWSLKRNRICGVDTTTSRFQELREPFADPSTLAPSALASDGELGELATAHYFPREKGPLFFDFPRGGWSESVE